MIYRHFLPVILALFASTSLFAATALSPLDPATRTGTLANGIRFFILKNAKPANRIEMRLVVQAGSLQETEAEKGLAHLVEHMEFEGTERFASQEIVRFLESNGMRFGADLNAQTSMTSTQYFLDLPADDAGAIAKGLQILEDWAHGPKVAQEYLDKEKKIVAEENRVRYQNAQGRRYKFENAALYAGSVYAGHEPIGDMKLVEAFSAKDIRCFVDTWYTPKAMSLVIVGSSDPEAMEKQLRASFTSAFSNAAGPVSLSQLPPVAVDSVASYKDRDLGNNLILWRKIEDPAVSSIESIERWNLLGWITQVSFRRRFDDLSRQPEAGIRSANLMIQWGFGHCLGYTYEVIPREGQIEAAISSYLAECKRAAVFGLTKREFNEGIKAFLDSNEASLSMASNTANHDMAGWIAGWIVDGQPVNFTRELYVYRKSLAKSLSLEELNTDLARYILPSPAKMLVETIDKPGTQQPNADDLAAIKAQTLKAEVVAKPDRPLRLLVDHAPAKGQVVKIEAVAGTPFKLWTLSNGIRVYTYRNALTRGDFQFRAFAPGGLSEVSDADYQNARFGIYLLSRNGAGGLNQSELEDFLFGKMARVGFSLDEYEAGISGSCNPTDLDDMLAFFQLLYTRLTSLRRDAGAEKTALTDLSEDLANGESRPDKIYEREITRLMTDGSPRLASFTSERVKELDSDRAAAILPRFFANTANLSFVICGDFDEKNLKSLIETWLASLPNEVGASTGAIATNGVKDLGIRPSVGPQTSTVSAGHDDRAVVNLLMDTPYPYSAANRHLGDILREVLAIRMREVLRQDKGGTYTVGVRVDVEAQPYPHVRTRVTFTCSPQNKEALEKAATQELAAIAGGALGDNAFAKAVEILRRKAETDIKTNAYWVDNIHLALRNGEALASIPEWPAFYTGVKKADIATLAAAIIKPEAAIVVVLEPEAQP